MEDIRDVIIIGSGPAAFTAALYTARAHHRPLILAGFFKGGQPGGQLMTTTDIENFPGFPEGIAGPALMANMQAQAERFGAEVRNEDVDRVDFSHDPFEIETAQAVYRARAVIISTGASARRLGTPAEARFWNKGISACATCDGALPIYRNQPIAVIGGGDTAMEEANFLSRFASSVTVIHRRPSFRASKVMLERAERNPKVHFKTPFEIADTKGNGVLMGLVLRNTETDAKEELPVKGLFLAIGHHPNTEIFSGQIKLESDGLVWTDGNTRTSVPGVFAAGDCVDRIYRQAITAAGQGCMAALQVEKYFEALPVLQKN